MVSRKYLGFIAGAGMTFASSLTAWADTPIITNVRATQRTDGSKLVDINYDLVDPDGSPSVVTIQWDFVGEPSPCRGEWDVYGDVGPGVKPGINKHAIWAPARTFPNQHHTAVIYVHAESTCVDSLGDVGAGCSIAAALPSTIGVAYLDRTNHVVKYAERQGNQWVIDAIPNSACWPYSGSNVSLAYDWDSATPSPLIAFEGDPSALRFATRETGAWQVSTLDTASYPGRMGQYCSVLADSDCEYQDVEIAYKYQYSDGPLGEVRLIRRWNGTWLSPLVVPYAAEPCPAQYISSACLGMDPFIAYLVAADTPLTEVTYRDGVYWNWPVDIFPATYPRLARGENTVAFAGHSAAGVLFSVFSNNTWSPIDTIASDASGSSYIGLAGVAGEEYKVAYADSNNALWVAERISAASPWEYTILDDSCHPKSFIAAAALGSLPYVAYYDPASRDLHVCPGLTSEWVMSDAFQVDTYGMTHYYGVALPTWWHEDYAVHVTPCDSRAVNYCNKALDWLAQSNWVGTLAICPAWFMPTSTASMLYPDPHMTPSDDDVRAVIRLAQSKGWHVLLKPHVDALDSYDRKNIDPEDPESWFFLYRQFIWRYANIAADAQVDLFCIGTELARMSRGCYRDEWLQVIQAARNAGYQGLLTYAANFDEYRYINDEVPYLILCDPPDFAFGVSFWDQLDIIGIDAYFPLTNCPDNPTTEELIAAWTEHVERVGAWRTECWPDKQVLFTEIGYPAIENAHREPWRGWNDEDICDEALQHRCYQAALTRWRQEPWFLGMMFWAWPAQLPMDLGKQDATLCDTRGYAPYHKDAAMSVGLTPASLSVCVDVPVEPGYEWQGWVSVAEGLGYTTFTVTWDEDNADVSVWLTDPNGPSDPDGTDIYPETPGVNYLPSYRYISYGIHDPEAGEWMVHVLCGPGVRDGIAVTLSVSSAPPQTDSDGDAVPDVIDNCPEVQNPDQRDSDYNGLGDACQSDLNGDGSVNCRDFLCLVQCLMGPDVLEDPNGPAWCANADLDGDADVELRDLAAFQRVIAQDCLGCQSSVDCDDGDACNGAETCDVLTGECLPGVVSPDCNGNSRLDSCDIADGTSEDCQPNGIPDECDIAAGTSEDANGNGVPDECEDGGALVLDMLTDPGFLVYEGTTPQGTWDSANHWYHVVSGALRQRLYVPLAAVGDFVCRVQYTTYMDTGYFVDFGLAETLAPAGVRLGEEVFNHLYGGYNWHLILPEADDENGWLWDADPGIDQGHGETYWVVLHRTTSGAASTLTWEVYDSSGTNLLISRSGALENFSDPMHYFWIDTGPTATAVGTVDFRYIEVATPPSHDLNVELFELVGDTNLCAGEPVTLRVTVDAGPDYVESAVLSLSIGGPGGYSYGFEPRTVTVDGEHAETFIWDTSGLVPGDYTATIIGEMEGDCNLLNNQASLTVTLHPVPSVSFYISVDETYYVGDTVHVEVVVPCIPQACQGACSEFGSNCLTGDVGIELTWPDQGQSALSVYDYLQDWCRVYYADVLVTQLGHYVGIVQFASDLLYGEGTFEFDVLATRMPHLVESVGIQAAFVPDGRHVVTWSAGGVVRMWDSGVASRPDRPR